MAWIKMRDELQTHPKVVRILSATKSDKFRVIGGLHAVWCVFDVHSEDGVLFGYTPDLLDHMVGWMGLSDAMMSVGWLHYDGAQTLSLPEFEEHNGQSAKRRADDSKRKKRARDSGQMSEECPQNVRREWGTEKEKEKEEDKRKSVEPEPSIPSPLRVSVAAAKKTASPPKTGLLWISYSEAYKRRYNTDPVRNAKVNGQLSQIVDRLGAEEAPEVAAWYVASQNRFYVQKRHAVDCLLADAEGLRTEWATGNRVTETRAREADRLQTSGDMWGRLIEQHKEIENGKH
jgi:hypothetical protein